tara:strand:- start:1032 stop:1979 length:948 start_codon:yes stop_codon:yes gene_type:complete
MSIKRKSLDQLFEIQKEFNNLIYGTKELPVGDREEITKSLCLAIHAEVSDLISALNYKEHYNSEKKVEKEKILYESVDVVRYAIAILNLWEFKPCEFWNAFLDKDNYLASQRKQQETSWSNQPVLIVDLDDVLIQFRDGFIDWLEEKFSIVINRMSSEYYTTKEVMSAGLNPEEVFNQFILDRKIKSLQPEQAMIDTINSLSDEGYWIHLLTARPKDDLLCFYDTYTWLKNAGLNYDRLDFSGEKYRWCAKSEYFNSKSIVCAIDDSPKHAAEYAKHGIDVCVPSKSYNLEVHDMKKVHVFNNSKQLLEKIKNLS